MEITEDSWLARCCTAFGLNGIKALLIVFKFLLLMLGWAMVGVGAWMHICQEEFYYIPLLYSHPNGDPGHPLEGLTPQGPLFPYKRVSEVLVALGAVLTLTGSIGCCGVYAESSCFLTFYLLILLSVLFSQIIIGAVAVVVKEQSLRRLTDNMHHQVRFDYHRPISDYQPPSTIPPHSEQQRNEKSTETYEGSGNVTFAWNRIQLELECCGADSSRDYMWSWWFNQTADYEGRFVPTSCCTRNDADDDSICQVEALLEHHNSPQTILQLNSQGCYWAIVQRLKRLERGLIALLCLLLILQIVDALFVLLMMKLVQIKLSYFYTNDDQLYHPRTRGRSMTVRPQDITLPPQNTEHLEQLHQQLELEEAQHSGSSTAEVECRSPENLAPELDNEDEWTGTEVTTQSGDEGFSGEEDEDHEIRSESESISSNERITESCDLENEKVDDNNYNHSSSSGINIRKTRLKSKLPKVTDKDDELKSKSNLDVDEKSNSKVARPSVDLSNALRTGASAAPPAAEDKSDGEGSGDEGDGSSVGSEMEAGRGKKGGRGRRKRKLQVQD